MKNFKIAIAGAGNVATHLARALDAHVVAVASRNVASAFRLTATLSHAVPCTYGDIARYNPDIIIISVPDAAVASVAAAIGRPKNKPLVVHTSGSIDMSVMECVSPRVGVLYPLQTFTAGVDVKLSDVPFFLESRFPADLADIEEIARLLSPKIYFADAERRRTLHIAGVFTSNFTNILMDSVQRVLARDGYSLDVVKPLLDVTVAKAFAVGPENAQTGPARRGDTEVLRKHESELPDDLKPVYHALSKLIIDRFNPSVDYE